MAARPLPRPPPFRRGGRPSIPIPLAIFATLNAYVWFRVVYGSGLGWRLDLVGTAVVITGAAATIAAIRARFTGGTVPSAVATVGYAWLGVFFLAFSASVATEPVRAILALAGHSALDAPLSAATGVGVLGLAGWGYWQSDRWQITRTRAPVRGLDPRLDGFRVVQLSDVHVGHGIDRAFVERVVAATNALEPDLIAITGDLVDGSVEELRDSVAPLADLRAKHGVFFVTGNHEYYAGAPKWIAHLATLGIRVLRNESVRIERGGAAFDLVGVDDLFGGLEPGHGMDLDRAMAGRDPAFPAILLSHQPATVDLAEAAGVALQLSGHTHGGQIYPFHHLVRTQQPYLGGLVQHGATALYVHRGTGWWGPPIRVGARSEIALLMLASVPSTGSAR